MQSSCLGYPTTSQSTEEMAPTTTVGDTWPTAAAIATGFSDGIDSTSPATDVAKVDPEDLYVLAATLEEQSKRVAGIYVSHIFNCTRTLISRTRIQHIDRIIYT
jgi:hypothetical protein